MMRISSIYSTNFFFLVIALVLTNKSLILSGKLYRPLLRFYEMRLPQMFHGRIVPSTPLKMCISATIKFFTNKILIFKIDSY